MAGLLLGEMLEALFFVGGAQKFMQDDPEGAISRSCSSIGLEARPVNPPVRSLKAPSDRDYSR